MSFVRVVVLSVLIMAGVGLSVPVSAEESKQPPAAAAPSVPAEINPYMDKVREAAADLAKDMTNEESLALASIKNGYGMVEAVRIAQRDVKNAVEKCGTDNPDLKQAMSDRFTAWNNEIDPLLAGHEQKIKELVNDKTFKSPKKINDYLDLIGKMAKHADDKLDKRIITTPQACKNLQDSMDGSQGALAKVLKDIDWSPMKDDGAAAVKPAGGGNNP